MTSAKPESEILRAKDVTLKYGSEEVLRGISVAFRKSEAVAITGPSGSGKTSLLYCLSGLERLATGTITLLDNRLSDLTPDKLSKLRLGRVGFVFQSSDLVPELTLRQNIALPLELGRIGRRKVSERVNELVNVLGLAESADRKPSQVSGGQAQRCAVARAVAARPTIVFADEPTGALDQRNRDLVLGLLLEQVRAIDGALVTVTHDPEVASWFDRRISLADGQVAGDTNEVEGAGRS